jgi:hypothetical protein
MNVGKHGAWTSYHAIGEENAAEDADRIAIDIPSRSIEPRPIPAPSATSMRSGGRWRTPRDEAELPTSQPATHRLSLSPVFRQKEQLRGGAQAAAMRSSPVSGETFSSIAWSGVLVRERR